MISIKQYRGFLIVFFTLSVFLFMLFAVQMNQHLAKKQEEKITLDK